MHPNFVNRQQKLRAIVKEEKIDSLILTGKNDIYYYTGYMPVDDHGFLLLLKKKATKPILMLPGLEGSKNLKTADVRLIKKTVDMLRVMGKNKSIGFDQRISYCMFSAIKGASKRWKPLNSEIGEMRAIKESYEIDQIKESINISKKVWEKMKVLGKTEIKVANDIESTIIGMNAKPSFETIVLSGNNASYIHYRPEPKKIRSGELVIIDFGVRHNWYCSDITRTFCRTPSKKQKKIIEDVRHLQTQIMDKIVPGAKFSDVDKFYEKISSKMGYKSLHSFGHGVGLDVHERPWKDDVLKENMIVTVEPGIYIKNFGGCRIEDMLLIKKNKVEVLSKSICSPRA